MRSPEWPLICSPCRDMNMRSRSTPRTDAISRRAVWCLLRSYPRVSRSGHDRIPCTGTSGYPSWSRRTDDAIRFREPAYEHTGRDLRPDRLRSLSSRSSDIAPLFSIGEIWHNICLTSSRSYSPVISVPSVCPFELCRSDFDPILCVQSKFLGLGRNCYIQCALSVRPDGHDPRFLFGHRVFLNASKILKKV